MLEAPAKIQGKTSKSSYEINFATAATKAGLEFIYQVPVLGAAWSGSIRGGVIIDFVMITPPRDTPVFINSRYFHNKGKQADFEYQLQRLQRYIKHLSIPLVLWDEDVSTIEAATDTVRREFL